MDPLKRPDTIPNDVLVLVHNLMQPQGLTDIQEKVLSQCWEGTTYQGIADATGYDDNYIRAIGAQIWQALSRSLDQKVSKHNFRVVLHQTLLRNQVVSQPRPESVGALWAESGGVGDAVSAPTDVQLELPRGQVPLSSPLYLERQPIESQCYEGILQPGALIRIKAPKQMGKTSLMTRIVNHARQQGCHIVTLNLELANAEVLSDVDRFLKWFCAMVGKALRLPNQINTYWDDICGSSYNCTDYFEGYLLAELTQPVVLALDNVDVVFNQPDIATAFFGVLRAWYESARYGDAASQIWQKLRMVVVYSTEVYITLSIHKSPFNVGIPIELPEFTPAQIFQLIEYHQLDWTDAHAQTLHTLVGGNPYLVRLTLYHAKKSSLGLNEILDAILGWSNDIELAAASSSDIATDIYTDHLQQRFWALQPYPALLDAFKQVMTIDSPVDLDPVVRLKLEGMGLIRIERGKAIPACDLYRYYFRQLFAQTA
ncbi:MAG: AAA-like domain-containing protein [Cyanobacteria bacterium P01_F01_bin.150]